MAISVKMRLYHLLDQIQKDQTTPRVQWSKIPAIDNAEKKDRHLKILSPRQLFKNEFTRNLSTQQQKRTSK
jgi:hypothetical protein